MTRIIALLLILLVCPIAQARAPEWISDLRTVAIQDGGRTMPLDTYARRVATELTGRSSWGAGKGPEAFSDRHHIELLCDLLFEPETLFEQTLIKIDRRPLKASAGLEVERRFFSPHELLECRPLFEASDAFRMRRERDAKARPTKDEQAAIDALNALDLYSGFVEGMAIAVLPIEGSEQFGFVGGVGTDVSTPEGAAYIALGEAYRAGTPPIAEVRAFRAAIEGGMSDKDASLAGLEVLYNEHNPWKMAAYATVLALLAMLFAWLTKARALAVVAGLLIVWSIAEQVAGLSMRVMILGRAPVSNTYESLLWMGLVALGAGLIAQALSRKSWYLAGGLVASLASILFAMLVPIADRTNALPAVLRSNYWLILHVLTIVASYGALLLAAVLGHIYLIRDAFAGAREGTGESRIIVQTYRVMQAGLVLLTIGTILGGVWAADSWGRFWGWDPKETWSLISIVVYFTMLHARYIGWLRDFGLAVASIVGFLAIVWTFYGVNYVMATGLHSYGFGSGGERWVLAWAIAEGVFITACSIRQRQRTKTIANGTSNAFDGSSTQGSVSTST